MQIPLSRPRWHRFPLDSVFIQSPKYWNLICADSHPRKLVNWSSRATATRSIFVVLQHRFMSVCWFTMVKVFQGFFTYNFTPPRGWFLS